MKRRLVIFLAFLWAVSAQAAPLGFSLSGVVRDADGGTALSGVVVSVGSDYLWGVTDSEGRFSIDSIQKGTYEVKVSCLGYVDFMKEILIDSDVDDFEVLLKESSLALKEVVVTAQRSTGAGTTHTLGRDALNHLQMSSMSDMSALLPGGKTINPDLTTSSQISLRSGGSSAGNAAFGTAVEVDGVRLGNNAGFGEMAGVDTRSIAVDNVESVEVITGVPSAEYGDLGSGMVRVHTKKGRTPLNVNFTVNPRTYQTSVSKGIGLPGDGGVLNVSGEWARATKKLVSPYESYTRRGATLAYSNTFRKVLRFEAGATVNVGGMNSEDDPDAFSGEFTKARANSYRANTSLSWQLGKNWITSLRADANVNFADNLTQVHKFNTYGSVQPAVHSEQEGYYIADKLPLTYFSDQMTDSKELDLAASLKYALNKRWDDVKSNLKAGVQWKANGNTGRGEYYEDPSLAANGYRPRPYSDYPFMHNLSVYAEENLILPVGKGSVDITAGLRMENVFIAGTEYDHMNTLSPRFNIRWNISDNFSIRGGWGVTEKLPSFYILYPKQEYRDIRTFDFSHGGSASYVYYTQPYSMVYNPSLRWQRSSNTELGLDLKLGEVSMSLVGYCNMTKFPYRYSSEYTPFSYNVLQMLPGYEMPENPIVKVDWRTGDTYIRPDDNEWWQQMPTKVIDRTFAKSPVQDNGADIARAGAELTVDFPEIKAVHTSFRVDAAYSYTETHDESLSYYYQNGWSHTSLAGRSYQYVGIYANGGSGTAVVNGKVTHGLDANVTSITHIPAARLIVTCRAEMSILTRSRNTSVYQGSDYAFTVTSEGKTPTDGNIGDGDSFTAVKPVAYMDLDGVVRPFTSVEASDPAFSNLILKSGNAYTFAQDGYGFYMSANLSITKEIGDHVSLSFFANNFTNSRPYVVSMATGVGAIFTPAFYYGLTCRIKL